jgi:hypothetical protein
VSFFSARRSLVRRAKSWDFHTAFTLASDSGLESHPEVNLNLTDRSMRSQKSKREE